MKCRSLFSHRHAVPNTKYFVFCETQKENPWRMFTDIFFHISCEDNPKILLNFGLVFTQIYWKTENKEHKSYRLLL